MYSTMLLLSLGIVLLHAGLITTWPVKNTESNPKGSILTPKDDESVTEKIAEINSGKSLHLFEGDIFLTDHDDNVVTRNEMNVNSKKNLVRRNVYRYREALWPRREIPYEIHSSIPGSYHATILSAINEFYVSTCLKFRLRNVNDSNWIVFIHKTGCWSSVGRSFWKVNHGQDVSLGPTCNDKVTIMHELMHAAGFWHEHSRIDRNQFIEVLWENVLEGQEYNFNKYSHDIIDDLQVPYDYASIMHYGRKQFSKNGKDTMRALHDPNTPLGQNTGFSANDIHEINTLYDCKDGVVNSADGWSPWSSYGPCNIDCKKQRQRYCFSDNPAVDCPGVHNHNVETEVAVCSSQECNAAVDGHWGRWSSWTNCSKPCGPGSRRRTRLCDDPPPKNGGKNCTGSSWESQDCYLRRCGLGADDCQFDYGGLCFWKNDVNNKHGFDWMRRNGSTPSKNTGPSGDHSNGQDHYLFIESSSPAQQGYKARLISRTFPATTGRCLSFWYHMWGSSIGELNVYVKTKGSGLSKLWSKVGAQGNTWLQANVSLFMDSDYEIVFEGVRGASFTGDIAIDDVQFRERPCIEAIGCFNDGMPKYLKPLPILIKNLRPNIDWYNMQKTVNQCARLVHLKGYKIFGIQYYGECWSSNATIVGYDKYGAAHDSKCWAGVGGQHVNYVYRMF